MSILVHYMNITHASTFYCNVYFYVILYSHTTQLLYSYPCFENADLAVT